MTFLTRLVSVLVFAALALGEPQLSPHVVHERRSFNPEARGWRLSRRMQGDAVLPVKIGLTQQNLHTIEDLLLSVSHPESPDYGKHWTAEQVVDHFAPARETIESVTNWLTQSGISRSRLRLSPSKSWIEVNATVAEMEELLKTEYHVWQDGDGIERVGCHDYSVPEHVAAHVDIIKVNKFYSCIRHSYQLIACIANNQYGISCLPEEVPKASTCLALRTRESGRYHQ